MTKINSKIMLQTNQAIYLFQIYMFIPNLVMSYGVAFLVSLAFESPMMGLEKAIFKRDRRS